VTLRSSGGRRHVVGSLGAAGLAVVAGLDLQTATAKKNKKNKKNKDKPAGRRSYLENPYDRLTNPHPNPSPCAQGEGLLGRLRRSDPVIPLL
jgi:hypothetical protein